ncbi:probable glycerol-3-phosphate acyltransferase 3 [Musa acuminata AAA Group]|uniref:probable glycerol-3-phosphate acyltransferase 3 n=1 Tax=Musa acuminata AAA Group TaxID=214697 RepID=UPI0031DAC3ED
MNSKSLLKSLYLIYKFSIRRLRTSYASYGRTQKHPPPEKLSGKTIVCDMEGGLLRTSSTFPYFMLVALEAGGLLRGLLLLILCPLISCLSHEVGLRVMVMVCFLGLRKDKFRVGRAVLPKFFLEEVGLEGFEVVRRGGRRVCVSSMPTVMVEEFLQGYLDVEVVLGRELKVFGGYYTGLMVEEEEEETKASLALEELLGDEKVGKGGAVGFGSYPNSLRKQRLFSHCEEVYSVSEAEKRRWHPLPSSKYPKPLVFHDGRIAFRPTPLAALCMFVWLPLGFLLASARALSFILLPYVLSIPLLALLGMRNRVVTSSPSPRKEEEEEEEEEARSSRLYITNHRTLLDPLVIAAALRRNVTATTYSVSRISEWISPIRTVRLTRNREEDKRRMKQLLEEGELVVVCPEGTTCREPYLLRFSPLFTEVSREVTPVASETSVTMFYGTSTNKLKFLDPLFFLMNPFPCYEVEFMGRVPTGSIAGEVCSSYQMANHLQGEIGRLLGFHCTSLTRKDKYLMLAGTAGVVDADDKGR